MHNGNSPFHCYFGLHSRFSGDAQRFRVTPSGYGEAQRTVTSSTSPFVDACPSFTRLAPSLARNVRRALRPITENAEVERLTTENMKYVDQADKQTQEIARLMEVSE